MRIALISMKHVLGDGQANLERHRFWLDQVLSEKPDVIGFPEFSLTGWTYEPEQALTMDAQALSTLQEWAAAAGVVLATGMVERADSRLYNTCVVMGANGLLGSMRKVNLIAREGEVFTSGTTFPVIDIGFCRLGIATCADATVYEMFRLLSFRGAEVVFAPHANSLNHFGNNRDGWIRWRMQRWPLYAQDACVAIAGMSCAGRFDPPAAGEEETKFCSGAMVVDWEGHQKSQLAGAGKQEGVLIADIDIDALRKARRQWSPEFRAGVVYNRPDGWMSGIRGSDPQPVS